MIIREIFGGRHRFGEIQKSLDIAKNILSTRLKQLLEEGILQLDDSEGSSPRSRYVLTAKGQSLNVVLIALWQWGVDHYFEEGELPHEIIDAESGQMFERLKTRTIGGEDINPNGLRLVSLTK